MKPRIADCFILVIAFMCITTAAFAAHPLITDDTGTQGRGKFQLEVNGSYSRDSADGVVIKEAELGPTLSYGVTDTLDLVVGVPYVWVSVKADGETIRENGIADMDVSLKWRFHEREGFSLAIKPGITLPSGSEEKGLGSGKVNCSLFFIATKELKPFTFHLNLGYIRNQNDYEERKNLLHASLAAEMGVSEKLRVVVNGGIEQNTDRDAPDPAFVLAGLIYSVAGNFEVDAGMKFGLNRAEADYQLLAGITYRFK